MSVDSRVDNIFQKFIRVTVEAGMWGGDPTGRMRGGEDPPSRMKGWRRSYRQNEGWSEDPPDKQWLRGDQVLQTASAGGPMKKGPVLWQGHMGERGQLTGLLQRI